MEIKRIVVGMLQTNCYLLIDGGELAVVDPGDEADIIIGEIARSGAAPKLIINTHGHFDHTGGNTRLKEKYGLPVLAGAKEKGEATFIPDIALDEGQTVKFGGSILKVMETPGHTPGGICLFGDDFVISGDTLFDGSIGRTDLAGGSDRAMAASLERLDREIPDGTAIYPGHGRVFRYKKGMVREWLEFLK
jgi:hydroxyacylglutathione hydrolase